MNIQVRNIAAAALLAFTSATLNAQSADFLNNYSDARSMSMGGTQMASGAVTVNPAAPAHNERIYSLKAGYLALSPAENAIHGTSVSFSARVSGRIAVSVFGNACIRSPYHPTDGNGLMYEAFTPVNYMAGAGISYMICEGLSAGINAKIAGLSEISREMVAANPDLMNPVVFSCDFSVMYKIHGLSLTAGMTNIGNKVSFNRNTEGKNLPSAVRAGAGYRMELGCHSIGAMLDIDYYIFNSEAGAGIGIEYGFRDMIFGRAGFRHATVSGTGRSITGLPCGVTLGAGYKFREISVDAAYLIPTGGRTLDGKSPLEHTFMISLGWDF